MKLPGIDNKQYRAQLGYGALAWSADVIGNIGGLPISIGKLNHFAAGSSRKTQLTMAMGDAGWWPYEGKIFADVFSGMTDWGNQQMEAPAFYYADKRFEVSPTRNGYAEGRVILPHVNNPNVEVTVKGHVLDYGSVVAKHVESLGEFRLSIGLTSNGEDGKFTPYKVPELATVWQQLKALTGKHPHLRSDYRYRTEKFPLLCREYGAEISLKGFVGRPDRVSIKTRPLELVVRDENLESIAREVYDKIQGQLPQR